MSRISIRVCGAWKCSSEEEKKSIVDCHTFQFVTESTWGGAADAQSPLERRLGGGPNVGIVQQRRGESPAPAVFEAEADEEQRCARRSPVLAPRAALFGVQRVGVHIRGAYSEVPALRLMCARLRSLRASPPQASPSLSSRSAPSPPARLPPHRRQLLVCCC